MTESSTARLHALVEGIVQGVGFRMFVQREAAHLNLTGWVRNTWEGNVEVVAEGEKSQLEKLLSALKVGPASAYVTNVRFVWLPASNEFSDFRVRSTA